MGSGIAFCSEITRQDSRFGAVFQLLGMISRELKPAYSRTVIHGFYQRVWDVAPPPVSHFYVSTRAPFWKIHRFLFGTVHGEEQRLLSIVADGSELRFVVADASLSDMARTKFAKYAQELGLAIN